MGRPKQDPVEVLVNQFIAQYNAFDQHQRERFEFGIRMIRKYTANPVLNVPPEPTRKRRYKRVNGYKELTAKTENTDAQTA